MTAKKKKVDVKEKEIEVAAMSYDFNEQQITIPLSKFFTYRANLKELTVSSVTLSRLDSFDLEAVKSNIPTAKSDFQKLTFLVSPSIVSFHDENGRVIDEVGTNVLFNKMPATNLMTCLIYLSCLMRGTSLIASYPKGSCGHTAFFDIDPAYPYEAKDLKTRQFKLDVMELINVPSPTLAEPMEFKIKKKVRYQDQDILVESILVKTGTVENYMKTSNDPLRVKNVESWVIYDNIIQINSLSTDETTKFKYTVGIDILRLTTAEMKLIYEKFSEGTAWFSDKHYDCLTCGESVSAAPELSNFFAFPM